MVVTAKQFERIVSQQPEHYSTVTTGISGGVGYTSTTYYLHGVEFAEYSVWDDGFVEYLVLAHPDTPAEALEA